MLTNTFIHASGIGYHTEMRLWRQGILTWEDYLNAEAHLSLSSLQKHNLSAALHDARQALSEGDASYFARVLSPSDTWRAYPEFAASTVYLDIETTGTNETDAVTVIGLYDGHETCSFVRGHNLEDFPDTLSRYQQIITFFGRGFDVPVLRRVFPQIDFDSLIHIDLCHVFHRMGIKGGLKKIERQFGIQRSPDTDGMDGFDAVRLWYAYLQGNKQALDLLIHYNREDIVNLEPLMRYAYTTMRRHALPEDA